MQPRARLGSDPVRWPLRPARRHQPPSPPSVLIGRERDEQAAAEIVLGRRARLLTLVGPPGVGKTRLALAVAAECHEEFDLGGVFVELSAIRSADLVLETIAKAFGLRQQGRLRPADQLQAYLGDASVLLIVDNFEHVLEAGLDLAHLLTTSPNLVILATSRTALQLRWEQVYALAPLDPAAAFELFVDRAQAARADFVCSEADTAAVSQICARLDCLPLAIELAAARCVAMSPRELLNRLEPRLELLGGALRDGSPRHQTFRDAVDWSYKLLSAPERSLLRRLAVFVGTFTAEAVDAVVAGPAIDVLSSLVRKSLVRFEPASDAVESRFRLLEIVREYACERLVQEDEAPVARLRHAEYYCAFVEDHYSLNFGPEQPEYGARLERDYPNFRQSLDWALDAGKFELAQRLGAALHWFWYSRGYLVEGTSYLQRALAAVSTPPAARAAALRALGAMLLNQGSYAAAIDHLQDAVQLGRQCLPEASSPAELAMAHGVLGVTQLAAGMYAAAEVSIRESLSLFETSADEWGIATANEVLGAIAALRGDAEVAERLARQSLEVHRRLGSRENIARVLDVLGYAAALRSELKTARECFEESLALRRAATNRPATAAVLARLALVAYLGQDWVRAAQLCKESLALAQEVGDAAGMVRCLGQVAALALACGADRGAVARLGIAVRNHQTALGLASPPVEQIAARRLAAAVRAEVSPIGLAAAWLGGRALDLNGALQLGLRLLEDITARTAPSVRSAEGERLTRRETQVAALIAQGLTNRQIAEELVIAQRTVDTHVERILAKLSFSTRSQVAAWAVGQRLLVSKDT